MAKIEIINLIKRYDDLEVLHDLSFEIADKEFVVLVGPSGCGKTTLLRMIAGLEEVTQGKIILGDRVINYVAEKDRDIAMVFQSYALYPHMTVRGNMSFSLRMRKMDKAEQTRRIEWAAEMLELSEYLDRYPRQLSGGQRQRVAMGRALVREPMAFLLDEPLSNLDAQLRVQMRTELRGLHQRLQATMVYVTHDQIEAMTLADRIAVLKDGELQQIGTPYEIYNDPVSHFVADFMGSPGMNFIECIVKDQNLIIESGGQKYELIIPCTEALIKSNLDVVLLGIRPEMLTEIQPSTADSSFVQKIKFDVEVIEPMGADTVAIGQWNENEVMARLSPESGNSAGKGFELQVDTSKAILFDPNSGLRIR